MTRLSTFVTLSTVHISPQVSQSLSEKGSDSDQPSMTSTWLDSVTVCEFAYGHWVRVPIAASSDPSDVAAFNETMEALPECLAACIRHAQRYGARWILFDRDEEPIGDLHSQTW